MRGSYYYTTLEWSKPNAVIITSQTGIYTTSQKCWYRIHKLIFFVKPYNIIDHLGNGIFKCGKNKAVCHIGPNIQVIIEK